MELDAIAAVVIGGTLLAGGTGYVAGALRACWCLALIQTLIVFDGTLSSWWTKIVIGTLLFAFCAVQRGGAPRPTLRETRMLNRRQLLQHRARCRPRRHGSSGSHRRAAQALAPTPPWAGTAGTAATTLTEAQARETAAIQVPVAALGLRRLQPSTSSGTSPRPRATSTTARPNPRWTAMACLLPAPNRFPSSINGAGFKPLADDIHRLGLKFGVHLMRGIARGGREEPARLWHPVHRARHRRHHQHLPWNPDMYGVDIRRPGAQAYYDSVFALFASWGVDFVKMDDREPPYDAHAPRSRPRTAPSRPASGPCCSASSARRPCPRAEHVRRFAQMWRISDDFWDEWPMLDAQFTRLENWNPHRRPGAWPDADMLPSAAWPSASATAASPGMSSAP